MGTVKGLVRTKSFWVFIVVGLLGGLGAIFPIPMLGVIIAALTIFGVSLQGVETVLTQKDIDRKQGSVLNEIDQSRKDAAKQHTEALQEIGQARAEAAKQYAEATQEIKKAKEEALLLIKWVPRLWIFIYSVADKLVTPTVLKWIRRRIQS
jgi:uncharacterized membrane protein YhiD involved in acid resistance